MHGDAVDGVSLRSLKLPEVRALLKGPLESQVRLTISRLDQAGTADILELTVTRSAVQQREQYKDDLMRAGRPSSALAVPDHALGDKEEGGLYMESGDADAFAEAAHGWLNEFTDHERREESTQVASFEEQIEWRYAEDDLTLRLVRARDDLITRRRKPLSAADDDDGGQAEVQCERAELDLTFYQRMPEQQRGRQEWCGVGLVRTCAPHHLKYLHVFEIRIRFADP